MLNDADSTNRDIRTICLHVVLTVGSTKLVLLQQETCPVMMLTCGLLVVKLSCIRLHRSAANYIHCSIRLFGDAGGV